MSSVFELQSDKQFIRALEGYPDIYVNEYKGDLNEFNLITAGSSSWVPSVKVGPSATAPFKKLEVHGVTIEGDKLAELIKDLTITDPETQQTFHPSVNRQGLCILYVGAGDRPIKRLRINDHFGWTKYGVKPRIETIWSVWDMSTGAVLVAHPTSDGGGGSGGGEECWGLSESWKKIVAEKEKMMEERVKMMEEKEGWLRKELEEKEREVSSLKAVVRTLSSE